MSRRSKVPAPPGASRDWVTACANSISAVSTADCSTPTPVSSILKVGLIDLLRHLSELSPGLVAVCGRIMLACWRGFREA
jgi:hypothetical protein